MHIVLKVCREALLVMHMAEQNVDATAAPKQQPACDGIKKAEKDEPDLDEFDKRWADIEYLIRKPFCCK